MFDKMGSVLMLGNPAQKSWTISKVGGSYPNIDPVTFPNAVSILPHKGEIYIEQKKKTRNGKICSRFSVAESTGEI